ncbi:hypothetical protein [Streptomyces sp. NPDC058542]|uniref:hypothetical protein n=1 Tax=Streptomyces sp. NPDC058542 TaxID=3346543 RepID=UPI00364B1253
MTEYIAQCRYNPSDTITARVEDGAVWLVPGPDNVSPSTDAARTFARGILALADEADGGEVRTEPAPDTHPKVGDQVIVIEDDPGVRTGEFVDLVGTLTEIGPERCTPYLVKFGGGFHGAADGSWYCQRVEKVADEPEPLADWEKDLLSSAPKVGDQVRVVSAINHTREAYLHRAAELLGINPSASDLIELADYLAGGDA